MHSEHMWAGTVIVCVLFYCLAVVFVKINYVVVSQFVFHVHIQKPSTVTLLASRALAVHSLFLMFQTMLSTV